METFAPATIMSFREGLEAFLIIAILLKFLDKTDNESLKMSVWKGTSVGIVGSLIFGFIVMVDILQEPGRELNLLRIDSIGDNSHDEPLKIIGLKNQYSVSEPIQIQVIADDQSFNSRE